RAAVLACLAAACVAFGAGGAAAQSGPAVVVELRIDGVVDPFVADHVEGGIADAADEGAAAVLLTLDTPGGLDSSMRQITQAILNAEIPVIGYVSPQGARAASAGTFILLSTNIAAMAPATNVGAAQPVGLSGAVASEKAVNDAAEYIVSIAEARGRYAEWAESAVRDAESISAEEAQRHDRPGVGRARDARADGRHGDRGPDGAFRRLPPFAPGPQPRVRLLLARA